MGGDVGAFTRRLISIWGATSGHERLVEEAGVREEGQGTHDREITPDHLRMRPHSWLGGRAYWDGP